MINNSNILIFQSNNFSSIKPEIIQRIIDIDSQLIPIIKLKIKELIDYWEEEIKLHYESIADLKLHYESISKSHIPLDSTEHIMSLTADEIKTRMEALYSNLIGKDNEVQQYYLYNIISQMLLIRRLEGKIQQYTNIQQELKGCFKDKPQIDLKTILFLKNKKDIDIKLFKVLKKEFEDIKIKYQSDKLLGETMLDDIKLDKPIRDYLLQNNKLLDGQIVSYKKAVKLIDEKNQIYENLRTFLDLFVDQKQSNMIELT